MKKKLALVFQAERTGYSIDQVEHPLTVGELKELLEGYDDDAIVILSHDNGYTFGSLSDSCDEYTELEDGDWELDPLWYEE